MSATFDMIGLITSDLDASLAFYRDLGLEVPERGDASHVEITLPGGLRLAWDTTDTIRSFDPHWNPPTGGHRVAIAFRCLTVDEVDATYQRLVRAGHDGHKPPWDAPWGQRYAILRDPDGNPVDLFADSN
ncbi:MAG: glyoxalase [Pseudonocardiales bacterium]|nr:MAG: glyoxalase [Pseudonocardiales bacterium]